MPDSLADLLEQRQSLLQELLTLGDFRPGSITATQGKCGKVSCRCHRPHHPGHGPNYRLTYKVSGKTSTETFPTAAAQAKTEREVAAFRRFQQLTRDFVELNEKICRLRPVEEQAPSAEEKKRRKLSNGKSRGK
jgi:hypothetical protein